MEIAQSELGDETIHFELRYMKCFSFGRRQVILLLVEMFSSLAIYHEVESLKAELVEY